MLTNANSRDPSRTALQLIPLKICIRKPMQPSERIPNDKPRTKRLSLRRGLVPRSSPTKNVRQRSRRPRKSFWLKLRLSGSNLLSIFYLVDEKKKKKKKKVLCVYTTG